MPQKSLLRRRFFNIRKNKYYAIKPSFFGPLIKFLKKIPKDYINLSIYSPINYEINIFEICKINLPKNIKILLPIISNKDGLKFFIWEKLEPLGVNKYGVLEPIFKDKAEQIPDVVIVPLLAFDEKKNRLGYGKGYYDKFLYSLKKKNRKYYSIGVAFSFQKYKKLPIHKHDEKLDYILTEKGLI